MSSLIGRSLNNFFVGGSSPIYQQLVDGGYADVVWDLTRVTSSAVPSYPAGYEGTATGITVQQTTVPWSTTMKAPTFNGTSSFINIDTLALETLFESNINTLTLYAIAKVSSSIMWHSGNRHVVDMRSAPADDFVDLIVIDIGASGQFGHRMDYGGVAKSVQTNESTLDWFSSAITVDKPSDEVKAYRKGVQVGTTQTGLGVYVPNVFQAKIGQYAAASNNYFNGSIGLVFLATTVLSLSQIGEIESLVGL